MAHGFKSVVQRSNAYPALPIGQSRWDFPLNAVGVAVLGTTGAEHREYELCFSTDFLRGAASVRSENHSRHLYFGPYLNSFGDLIFILGIHQVQ